MIIEICVEEVVRRANTTRVNFGGLMVGPGFGIIGPGSDFEGYILF